MSENLILKTLNEVILFTKRIEREIAWNEKHTFLILSENHFFEIEKLKCFLIENTINDYAKKKLLNLARNCDAFMELDDKYQLISESEQSFSYFFEDTINCKTNTATNCDKLLYFVFTNNGFLKIDENKFTELYKIDLKFTVLNQQNIFNLCREILIMIVDYCDIKSINELREPQQSKINETNNMAQLLEKKDELKWQIERTKEKVIAQEKEISKQEQRAENGQLNKLAFEQQQLGLLVGELVKLQKELSSLKIKIKTLNITNNTQPQQTETSKPDEVKKEMHLKIFVENAFDIWEQMFESFKINKKKRTDLSFMYEVMLYDKLIHKTVSKKNIEDWINETYLFEIDKIHYTDIKTSANEKRMATYNLLKQSK